MNFVEAMHAILNKDQTVFRRNWRDAGLNWVAKKRDGSGITHAALFMEDNRIVDIPITSDYLKSDDWEIYIPGPEVKHLEASNPLFYIAPASPNDKGFTTWEDSEGDAINTAIEFHKECNVPYEVYRRTHFISTAKH